MDFTTQRLRVSALTDAALSPADLACLEAMLTPEVLAPLPPSVQDTRGGATAWLARRLDQGAVLAVRAEGLIGLAFVFAPEPQQAHIGYMLAQPHWGRGFATELLHGLIRALRPQAPLTLHAGVAADNPASARVLEKCGFTLDPGESPPDLVRYAMRLT